MDELIRVVEEFLSYCDVAGAGAPIPLMPSQQADLRVALAAAQAERAQEI